MVNSGGRSRAFVLYQHLDSKAHVTVPQLKDELDGRLHGNTVESHASRLAGLGVLVPDGKAATGRRGPRPLRYRVDHPRLHAAWWEEFLGSDAVRREFRGMIRWPMTYLRHDADGIEVPVAWLFDRTGGIAGGRPAPLDTSSLEPRVRRAILTVSRWLFREGFVHGALVFHPLLSYVRGWPPSDPAPSGRNQNQPHPTAWWVRWGDARPAAGRAIRRLRAGRPVRGRTTRRGPSKR